MDENVRLASSHVNCSTAVCTTVAILAALGFFSKIGQAADHHPEASDLTRALELQVIAWRRNFHEHPERSNREFRTSKIVAEHLRKLGLEVHTGIAHTGVVPWLKGSHPGPTVALRADMDALPITEKTDVPFRSHATATYRGDAVGVMHACGHDAHTAILMGVAQILTSLRASLYGNVLSRPVSCCELVKQGMPYFYQKTPLGF